jgi:hypothetical protein
VSAPEGVALGERAPTRSQAMLGIRRALRVVLDVGAVGAALIFIGSYFPRAVMFSNTITNGGDMASHYYPALFLRDVLLPKGQVIGWCPGNYCGFPLFQIYFPLPFLVIVGLSHFMPLTVAFKLGSVLGTFLLPVCAYLSLRMARVPFPGPALGALATLPFLFMEANSMWGGNIPSTLAGEFALSLALSLAVLFLGTLRRTMDTGRGAAWNGLLEALVGLSHGYPLLWVGWTSLAELATTRDWWRRLGLLVVVHGVAILVMGFFLLQLVGYGPWTTAYNHSWPIQSWREVMPPILWPATAIAVVTGLGLLVAAVLGRRPFPRPLVTLWAAIAVGVVFWLTAHSFHVVDIRFWPFIQLGLCLAAAAGLGYVLSALPLVELWPAIGALAILPFVQAHITFIPSWIRWNYSGFEQKSTWPVFKALNTFLAGDFRDPRVVYEHSAQNESLGTVRAFESLPLFSGRSTLEGLYMQSSPTAPFVFFIQSEVSKEQSCPFPDYGCSRLDLDHGVKHLRMFNVSQFIVRSPEVRAAIAKRSDLVKQSTFGPYEVYRVTGNADHYAVPLTLAPVLVLTDDWKDLAYRWFKEAGPDDPTPVFATDASEEERRQFAAVVSDPTKEMPRRELAPPPSLSERMETDRITITGARPGHPILVRISYHPRWKSTTGEKVWLAGPSFMLVVPKGDRIELVFDGGGWVTAGHVFTALGLGLLVLAALPPGRRGLAWIGRRAAALVPAPVIGLLEATGRWPAPTRRRVLAGALVAAAIAFTTVAVVARVPNADGIYREAMDLYNADHLDEAQPLFREVPRLAPLSAIAIHATYFTAIIDFRKERWREAEQTFRHLVATFPEAPNAPEALYHVGLCRLHLGDTAGARALFEEVHDRFPSSPWSGYAADRLKELGPPA